MTTKNNKKNKDNHITILDRNTRIIGGYKYESDGIICNLTVETNKDGKFTPILKFNTYSYDDTDTIFRSEDMSSLYVLLGQEILRIKYDNEEIDTDQTRFIIRDGECFYDKKLMKQGGLR